MRFLRLLPAAAALAALGSLCLPQAVLAQATTGTIDGRVVDQSQAAVPGATVTARNEANGLTRTATVSATGTYRIPSLPAGRYEVQAALAGFSTQVRKAVDVLVASTTTADFSMKVATVSETIEVQGETPLVQSTTSDVGQVITNRMIENIPLNGRKFQDLSLLVPGTRSSNYYDPTKTEVGGISYGGATGRNVIISVDGGDNNDGVVRGLLQQFSEDAIQEYKVTTQRYSAEYGRSTGGVVNVVTKSGTNTLHGTAFAYGRNESLNAKTYFQDKQNTDKPPFKQWQFGGSLGGPIQKDKAFFFLSYERNQRDDYATVSTNGLLPGEEGNFPQPFTNNLLTAKLTMQLNSNNNLVARYALEDNQRTHDFIGGNTLASAGAQNANKIHSGILKNTTTFSSNKVNEVLVVFQHFENNITAENPNVPAHPDARLRLRGQPEHAAADDPEALPGARRLLLPQGRLGRRPRLQGRGGAAALALRRLLRADALRVLQLRELARQRHQLLPQRRRRHLHRLGGQQQLRRQLDLRRRLRPGRLEAHAQADAEPGPSLRDPVRSVREPLHDARQPGAERARLRHAEEDRHEQRRPAGRLRVRRQG